MTLELRPSSRRWPCGRACSTQMAAASIQRRDVVVSVTPLPVRVGICVRWWGLRGSSHGGTPCGGLASPSGRHGILRGVFRPWLTRRHSRARRACCQHLVAGVFVLLSVILVPSPSRAAEADDTRSTQAQSLFDRGRELLAAGDVAQACLLLAESQRLDPGGGTLLNLAVCHERQGKLATAWLEYHDAQSLALRDGRPDRRALAAQQITAIEPRLPYLQVTLPADAPEGALVKVDGSPLSRLALGAPLPIDPGSHEVTATAPGYVPWTIQLASVAEAEHPSVSVPAFVPLASSTGPRRDAPGWHKPAAFVTGGLGLAGLGVGAAFGIVAISDWSEAKPACANGSCTSTAYRSWTTAHTAGIVSTASFVAGGALLATGAVLWFTRPKAPATVGIRSDGVLLVGATFQ